MVSSVWVHVNESRSNCVNDFSGDDAVVGIIHLYVFIMICVILNYYGFSVLTSNSVMARHLVLIGPNELPLSVILTLQMWVICVSRESHHLSHSRIAVSRGLIQWTSLQPPYMC